MAVTNRGTPPPGPRALAQTRHEQLGLGYPMGPFELIDYTGVDINYHVANVFFDEFKDPSMAPPSLLRRMTLAGQLGTKTGKGFYEYDEQGKRKS